MQCQPVPTRADANFGARRAGSRPSMVVCDKEVPMPSKPAARDSARAKNKPETTADKQRELQREQDRKEPAESGNKDKEKQAVQTSQREQPEEVPAQHLEKPGLEAEMELKPQFYAPDYRGSGKLKGMVALITGGDSGIGRAV